MQGRAIAEINYDLFTIAVDGIVRSDFMLVFQSNAKPNDSGKTMSSAWIIIFCTFLKVDR